MICDVCGQHEGTIRIKRVINGNISEMNICPECMRKQFTGNGTFDISFFINQLVNLLGFGNIHDSSDATCPVCGMKFSEFSKTGKLGCDHCYESFGKMLDPLIKKIHGVDRYPDDVEHEMPYDQVDKKSQILMELQEKLELAVRDEKYEEACVYRDQINSIRNGSYNV